VVVERRRHPVPAATHKVGESSVEIAANYFDTVLGLEEHLVGDQLKKFGFRFFFSEGRRDIDSVLELGASTFLSTPSYQLDRECVAFIKNSSDPEADDQPLPAGLASEALPAMGQSVPLANLGGQSMPLRWHAHNHQPLVWKPVIGWLQGDELGRRGSDSDIMSLYSGGRGSNLADLGEGALLGGRVEGQVTLYGLPNALVSGQVCVYAKATTTRTTRVGPGQQVVTHERTGGLKSGALVFRLEVDGSWERGRKSVSCAVPRLLVYLKERDLADRPDSYQVG
jgi:hypothetical protein